MWLCCQLLTASKPSASDGRLSAADSTLQSGSLTVKRNSDTSAERRQQSPAPSDTSAGSTSSNRKRAVRFQNPPGVRCQQSTATRLPANNGQDRGRPPAQRNCSNSNESRGYSPRTRRPRSTGSNPWNNRNNQRPSSGRASPASTPCLLYTSPSPRDRQKSRMPSSA